MVRFSIIVPVYNVHQYLERCLKSICGQTYTDIEIIIIDDGSNDGSNEIYEEYAKADERIIVIKQENKGLSAARNAGLDRATGEYILFVDSDDYIDTYTCEELNRIIGSSFPDIIVGGAIVHEDNRDYPMAHSNLSEDITYSGIEYTRLSINAREWYAPVWLGCYSRSYIELQRIRFKDGIYHEDLELQPRLFLDADKIKYSNKNFYHYCIRKNSITSVDDKDKNNKKLSDIISILEEWREVFSKEKYSSIQKLLYGMIAKQFLYFSKQYKNTNIKLVNGVDFRFLWKNALDPKEKAKALLFLCLPHIYINL